MTNALRGKDEFSRVVKGLQYMANSMSMLRTFKCIEPFKFILFNFLLLLFILLQITNKILFFFINAINILPMHHKLAAFIFILYSEPMQFIL